MCIIAEGQKAVCLVGRLPEPCSADPSHCDKEPIREKAARYVETGGDRRTFAVVFVALRTSTIRFVSCTVEEFCGLRLTGRLRLRSRRSEVRNARREIAKL